MKVLIITDSLSLPRKISNETVYYEQTYPYLLKKQFPHIEFVALGIGGGTIKDILRQLDYYLILNPDIFILQCGIVDCAPRIFKKWESRVIKKLRLQLFFKPFTSFLRKYRGLTFTNINLFSNSCRQINKIFFNTKTKIYSIAILPPAIEYEKILPGITKNINSYNSILKNQFEFISNEDFDPKLDILDDYHHLNANGHFKIFKKISKIIQSKLND